MPQLGNVLIDKYARIDIAQMIETLRVNESRG